MPESHQLNGKATSCNIKLCYSWSVLLIILLTLALGGCASSKLSEARREFHAGYPAKAHDILSNIKSIPDRDKLLYHMDKGLILFNLGNFKESTAEFLAASRLVKEQELIGISRQATSLVTSEWLTEYKGEYGERLWIHTYLMMNFLLQSDTEAALVEAKQALKLYDKYPAALSEDHFTRSLIAICYELLGEYNDAYIEYKKLFSQLPGNKDLAADLYFIAHRLGYTDDFEKYTPYLSKDEQDFLLKSQGSQVIIMAELGRVPEKIPGNIVAPKSFRFSFPHYHDSFRSNYSLKLIKPSEDRQTGETITDLRTVLVDSLEDRATSMIAKEVARVTIKESMAQAVEDNNGAAAGALVRTVLFLSEEPDTRGWETLPARFNLMKIRLQPGTHEIVIGIKKNNIIIGEIEIPEIDLSPGQKIFKSIKWPRAKNKGKGSAAIGPDQPPASFTL